MLSIQDKLTVIQRQLRSLTECSLIDPRMLSQSIDFIQDARVGIAELESDLEAMQDCVDCDETD